jgi:peptide/nickel transport system substrate-binding protein
MMTPVSRVRTALACTSLAAVALLGVTACQGHANDTTTSAGTLTIQGDAGDPTLTENFNPFSTTQLEGTRLIYEPMEIASSVNGQFIPFLATGHTFTDPKTLVFTLRSGVKWSDGKPFTAQDVLFTFNLLKKYPALDTTGVWSQVSGISASGNKVTVTFKQPSVPFASVVAAVPIVPQHLWSKVSGDPSKYTDTKPVGTGPFMLDKFAPTQYTEKKNSSYWQADKIAPSEVKFPAQSSNQSTNQLDVTSGKFDWSYNYLPDVKQTYVSKNPHNTYWFPPGGTIAMYLNLTKAPYNNVDFRKGISLALNRQTIADKAVNGYTGPASLSGLILPNLKSYLDPSLPNQGLVSQNTNAAKAEFQKAGFSFGDGKLTKNGKPVTISLEMPNNFTDWIAAAKEMKSELAQVGIAVNLVLPQYAQYEKDIQAGSFDAAMGGFGGTGSPYLDFNNALNSQFAAKLNTPTVNNFERFKSPEVDQALSQLAGAVGQQAQNQATYKLEQTMYTQQPIVLLYYGGSWGLFSTKNFTGWPSASDPYMLPTTYNNAMLVIVTHLKSA